MTEKLYYKDAYIKEFSATVIICRECESGYDVVLDKTAFFPEEGGQYSDTGSINGAKVIYVYEKEQTIHHVCKEPLSPGQSVFCVLDFEERLEKMQCHTAEHILSGLFHKYHGLENVGFHLGAVDVTMDVSSPLSREELDSIESLANGIVYKNVKVSATFPSCQELLTMNYRSKLDLKENVRIVTVGEYDACACCAPHVSYTGEIGAIKILDTEKLRGGMRLHIAAGRRAMRIFDSLYKTALNVSDLISIPKNELASGVENLLSNLVRVRGEYERFRLDSFIERAEKLPVTKNNAVLHFKGAQPNELRELAKLLTDRVGEYLVLTSGEDGSLQYVITTKTHDVKDVIKDINLSLNGRGGGKGNMASGTFAASIEEVEKYFK